MTSNTRLPIAPSSAPLAAALLGSAAACLYRIRCSERRNWLTDWLESHALKELLEAQEHIASESVRAVVAAQAARLTGASPADDMLESIELTLRAMIKELQG